MCQDGDGTITGAASLVMNVFEEPTDDSRVPARGQLKAITAELINPACHLCCPLRPAVAMQVQVNNGRSRRGARIEAVRSWCLYDGEAVYLSSYSRRPHHEVDLRNSHIAAVAGDAAIAAEISMTIG